MRYKIAYLTSKDPLDRRVSSGVYFYQSAALQKYCGDVTFLGPVDDILITLSKKLIRLLQKISGKSYTNLHCTIISRLYGSIFSQKLKQGDFDFVFADKASCEIAYLQTSLPVIYSTDATFRLLNGYYPGYSNLLKQVVRESEKNEWNAVNNSELVIVSSKWAAESVVNDYKYPGDRVYVLPRGANLDIIPSREKVLQRRKTDMIRLLYMGHDWYRKGYDVAYRTMAHIRSLGIRVKLVAVACSPPADLVDEDVEIIKYIDKNHKEGRQLFDDIMLNSDFYLVPTRAECMGIAFCEASAYGLPVITRDTGGVSEVVKNGINGYALNSGSDHKAFAEKIISIFRSDGYNNLVTSTRDYFEKRLNWDAWGIKMKAVLDAHFATTEKQGKEEFLEEKATKKSVIASTSSPTGV